MKDIKQQNKLFVALALWVETFMWLALTHYDYCCDERHIVKDKDLVDWLGLVLMIWLVAFPVVVYFVLRKKCRLTEHPIREGVLRIICWAAICLLISFPIVWAVDSGVWIVKQEHSSSGIINLNGIEYYYIPFIDCIVPPLIIAISLLIAIGKRIYWAIRNLRG